MDSLLGQSELPYLSHLDTSLCPTSLSYKHSARKLQVLKDSIELLRNKRKLINNEQREVNLLTRVCTHVEMAKILRKKFTMERNSSTKQKEVCSIDFKPNF